MSEILLKYTLRIAKSYISMHAKSNYTLKMIKKIRLMNIKSHLNNRMLNLHGPVYAKYKQNLANLSKQ